MRRPDPAFWAGKPVLVTGHTGFKGAWLVRLLDRLGARVTGLALPPEDTPNPFDALAAERHGRSMMGDIRDPATVAGAFARAEPEIVFHLAAQSLVRRSYAQPLETVTANVAGTACVLDACRAAPVRLVVAITTDKVYGGQAPAAGHAETDPLGGRDPYSASKAACELIADSWRRSFLAPAGIRLATARAGNVIGGGDWCADRIVPDAVRAATARQVLTVRHPDAVRPWQYVLDPLVGYLLLAEAMAGDETCAEAWNFGPLPGEDVPVATLMERFAGAWGPGFHWRAAPEVDAPAETGVLRLDSTKARQRLEWRPLTDAAGAVARAAAWYRVHAEHGPGPRLDQATDAALAEVLAP